VILVPPAPPGDESAEPIQNTETPRRPKLPPEAFRVLDRVEKLANPTPVQKRLAWFDQRGKKVRKVIRDLRALNLDVGQDLEDPKA
jgi:hypothetical protein